MTGMFKKIGRLMRGGIFTPRGWAVRASLIITVFVVLHLLGWRTDTKIISGTSPLKDFASKLAAARGVIYGLAYFGAVVLAPILLIAAGIARLLPMRSGTNSQTR